jgi:hypothetical protein
MAVAGTAMRMEFMKKGRIPSQVPTTQKVLSASFQGWIVRLCGMAKKPVRLISGSSRKELMSTISSGRR